MSLGRRLLLSYLLVVAVGMAAAAVSLASFLAGYENEVIRVRLEEASAPLVAATQAGLRTGGRARDVIDALADQTRAAGARLLVVNAQRQIVVDGDGRLTDQRLPAPDANGLGTFRDRGEDWLFVERALRPPVVGTVAVARPRAAFADALRALVPPLLVGALAAALVAAVAAAFLARTIARPLGALAATARRLAGGDWSARAPVAGPPETRALGAAFNEMAEEVGRSRDAERAFLADVSHDLRTPLTSIQGFAQAIVEGEARGEGVARAATVIQRESKRLVRMVETLLEASRLRSGAAPLTREDVDVGQVLAGAVEALAPQLREATVTVDLQLAGAPRVTGDPDRLAQLFMNLIANAIAHSPHESAIRIDTAREAGAIVVRVRDHGAGLPTGSKTRIFERHWRGEDARPGSVGLGLAIAQAIVEAHGGTIAARNATGGGAELVVRLPA